MRDLVQFMSLAVILILATPATLASLYLLVLTVLSATPKARPPASRAPCFDVFIPAHNEVGQIERAILSLQRLDWPAERYRIVVIADNCTDDTADVARNVGVLVLERHEPGLQGKGYALAQAFEWSRTNQWAEAVVVLDADSEASENLLASFAARMTVGESALQAHYGVLNASASWRTRLMSIAFGSMHKLRSRARERMGLSCGIRGNGWCVTHALLDKVPYQAFSLTEDVEFGADLGLAGHRVAYCDEAQVNGQMVTTERAARTQRSRWEGGRFKLLRSKVPALMRAALMRRDGRCLDLAFDLLVPPLSYLVLTVVALIAAAVLFRESTHEVFVWLGIGDALALVLYVARGWRLSGIGLVGIWDMFRVPGFIIWKVMLIFGRRRPTIWVRTKREKS